MYMILPSADPIPRWPLVKMAADRALPRRGCGAAGIEGGEGGGCRAPSAAATSARG
jgi:hypothetical protein